MARKRAGPLSILGTVLFAAPFLFIGLTMGSVAIQSGHVYAAIFGLAFTAGGVVILSGAINELRSVESRGRPTPAAITTAPGAGPHSPTARELYGPHLPHLPLAKIPRRRGEAFPCALGRRDAHGAWALLAFSLVANSAILSIYVRELMAMSFAVVILTIGLIIFGKLLVSSAKRLLALRKVVVVEVDAEPAYLGDTLRVHVAQRGPARLARLSAALVCKEHISHGTGKQRRSEDRVVYREIVLNEVAVGVARGETWTRQVQVTLPEWPPSFHAASNEIEWSITVSAEIDGWPDYEEAFVLRALPRVVT